MGPKDERSALSSMGSKDERRAHSSMGPKDERRAQDLIPPYSLLNILPSQQVRTKINSQQTDGMLMSAHLVPVSTTTKLACCVQKKWL